MVYKSLLSIVAFSLFAACSSNNNTAEKTHFTKADSVTETYLLLHDSLHQAWNALVKDEDEKIKNINLLLNQLQENPAFAKNQLIALDNRLDQLRKIRITQKNLSNPYVVEEYDFASTSIVEEVMALCDARIENAVNKTIQQLVGDIRMAESRVDEHRQHYDSLAELFNEFLESNQNIIQEADQKMSLKKRPLFKAALTKD